MNHNTGKSQKLNDDDMMAMQILVTDFLSMERGQPKTETGKEDLERNDFIIGKQKKEMKRLDATRLYREHQAELKHKEATHTEETTRLKNRISWQNLIIESLGFLLIKTSDIFRKAVHNIIRLARDYYKPRFDTEQISDIKSALNLFGDDRQLHRAARDFLYFTAKQKGELDNREQIKARREVNNVVEGHYDQQQKRGFSMRK